MPPLKNPDARSGAAVTVLASTAKPALADVTAPGVDLDRLAPTPRHQSPFFQSEMTP